MRPRQWVKNILVAAAPLAALGTDVHYDYRRCSVKVAVAFVVFSLAASSIYLVNDVRDVEADRQHPTKRFRPIAAGIVPRVAGLHAGGGAGRGVAGHRLVAHPEPGAGDGRLHRHAAGLLLRAQTSSGDRHLHRLVGVSAPRYRRRRGHRYPAVAMVFADGGIRVAVHGGRQALRRAATGRAHRRQHPQVAGELHQHLPAVRLDDVGHRGGGLLRAVGIRARPRQGRPGSRCRWCPFTIAILRYAVDVDGGLAGEPEDIALRDRVLQVLFLAWIGTIGAAVILG